MNTINSQNSIKPQFNGIYKIKGSHLDNINKNIENFLSRNEYIVRFSSPFRENENTYFYAITSDDFLQEKFFEKSLIDKGIKFWKSLPVYKILNKNILDSIFNENKKIQNQENWII